MREPFKYGDRVYVIRTSHGWYDGNLSAIVKRVVATETGNHWYIVKDDDGNDHKVNHTRDMRHAV